MYWSHNKDTDLSPLRLVDFYKGLKDELKNYLRTATLVIYKVYKGRVQVARE